MRGYSIKKSKSVKWFLKNRRFGCITLLQCHQIEAQSFRTVVRRTVSLVAVWRVKTCKFEFCWSVLDCKTFFPLNSSYVLWKVVGAGKKGNVIYFFVFFFKTITRHHQGRPNGSTQPLATKSVGPLKTKLYCAWSMKDPLVKGSLKFFMPN